MKTLLAVALGAQVITASLQNLLVIPLSNESDPLHITGARVESGADAALVLTLRLVNKTKILLNTDNVWLFAARFFTPQEMRRNGDRIIWSCAYLGAVGTDSRGQDIHPGAEVFVTIPISPECRLDHVHDHFFVHVQQITVGGRFGDAVWERPPGDAAALLKALQPHP